MSAWKVGRAAFAKSTRDICVWLLDKGCVCVITGQAGQGISVYDYPVRDVYV